MSGGPDLVRQARLAQRVVALAAPALREEPGADRLDLANALIAAGLWMAEEQLGVAGVADHLANVARTWADKARAGKPGVRGALN